MAPIDGMLAQALRAGSRSIAAWREVTGFDLERVRDSPLPEKAEHTEAFPGVMQRVKPR